MQYTRFFSQNININGPIHLDAEQQKRMMNIVATESRIATLEQANKALISTEQQNRFTKDIFVSKNTLKQLTGDKEPEALIREMYEGNE